MTKTAYLAGGCFWGMQDLFRKLPGVKSTRVGYCGGDLANPTYSDLKKGDSGHAEALEVVYDEAVIGFADLLEFFFQIHDPTTTNRQGNDLGAQYRSIIFAADDEEERSAREIIGLVDESGLWPGKVVTEILPTPTFYEAEPVHQDYLVRNPHGYTCHFPRPNWRLPRRGAA